MFACTYNRMYIQTMHYTLLNNMKCFKLRGIFTWLAKFNVFWAFVFAEHLLYINNQFIFGEFTNAAVWNSARTPKTQGYFHTQLYLYVCIFVRSSVYYTQLCLSTCAYSQIAILACCFCLSSAPMSSNNLSFN